MAVIQIKKSIVEQKIVIPDYARTFLSRPRLFEMLQEIEKKPLAVVQAPLGFGKTTLIASWARRTRMPVAWLTIDEGDNDPSRLCRYLIASFDTLDDYKGNFSDVMASSYQSITDFVDDALICFQNASDDVVLVIDNCHFLAQEGEAWSILAKIINFAPPCLHIVLSTQTELKMDLSTYRSQDKLVEIDERHLRVTEGEAQSLFRQMSCVSYEWLQEANRYLEGWPIALALLRRTLLQDDQEHPPPKEGVALTECVSLKSPSDVVYMCTHWCDEVVNRLFLSLSEELQSRARVIGCLGTCSEGLAAHVMQMPSNEVPSIVARLVSEGILRRWNDPHGQAWFGVSNFIRDVCRREASESDQETWYIRAAQWYKDHGMFNQAIEYASLAKEYDLVEKIVWNRFMTMFKGSEFRTIDEWISVLPEASLQKPRIHLMRSLPMAQGRRFDAMDESIALVMHALDESRKDRFYCLAKICAACAKATSAHRLEARAFAQEALSLLGEEDVYLRGIAHQIVAESYMESDIIEMLKHLTSLYEKGEWRLDSYYGHSLLSTITMVNSMLGCFRDQDVLDKTLSRYASSSENDPSFIRMRLGEAGRNCHEANTHDSHLIAKEIEDEVLANGIEIDIAYLYGIESINAFCVGDIEDSKRLFSLGLKESPLFLSYAHPSISQIKAMFPLGKEIPQVLSELCIDKDQPALSRIKVLSIYASTGFIPVRNVPNYVGSIPKERPMERFLWLLMLVYFNEISGKAMVADKYMLEALAIAEKEGYQQVFFNEASWIFSILKRTVNKESLFQTSLLKSMPQGCRNVAAVKSLTPREREIASFFDSDLSYKEIAERLFIAEETVRKHTKRVFAKLGVHSRVQAVYVLHNQVEKSTN